MASPSAESDVDDGSSEPDVMALLLRALVHADLGDERDPGVIETSLVEEVLDLDPRLDSVALVFRTAVLIEQVLVEIACRPTLGRTRSEVISILSHAAHAAVDGLADPSSPAFGDRIGRYGRETAFIGEVEVDVSSGTVHVAGRPVRLTEPETSILMMLLTHPDRVVSELEIRDALWPGRRVRPGVAVSAVNRLRRKLGDNAKSQNVIRTAWGRGYRLGAPLHVQRRTRPDPDAHP